MRPKLATLPTFKRKIGDGEDEVDAKLCRKRYWNTIVTSNSAAHLGDYYIDQSTVHLHQYTRNHEVD